MTTTLGAMTADERPTWWRLLALRLLSHTYAVACVAYDVAKCGGKGTQWPCDTTAHTSIHTVLSAAQADEDDKALEAMILNCHLRAKAMKQSRKQDLFSELQSTLINRINVQLIFAVVFQMDIIVLHLKPGCFFLYHFTFMLFEAIVPAGTNLSV